MIRLSIRWRLTFWYAVALAVILVVFCGLLVPLSYQQLLSRMDGELEEELQESLLEVQIARTQTELDSSLNARFGTHQTFDFIVFDQQRTVLFASSDVTPEMAKDLATTPKRKDSETFETIFVEADRYYRVASRSSSGPRGELEVRAITPLDPLLADAWTLLKLIAILLPLSLLLALMGGYFLAARALAPVEHIVGVANSITISQLDRRIAVSNPHDELGHLAETLNRLIERLEDAVTEIRRFTADASHELRTPLAILRSEAESALRKSRSEEEYQATLRVVVDEATRLGTLADQLLLLSRQDAGLDAVLVDLVEIDPILLDAVESLSPLADSREVILKAKCKCDASVAGNDLRLSQVFFNIIENAIKYSPLGATVEIESVTNGDHVQVVVRDHGTGIAPQHLARVFERFYRVDPSRNRAIGGSGLGLSIAKSIVTSHGGTIEIESEEGSGSQVIVTLPKRETPVRPELPLPNATDAIATHTSNSHVHASGS